LRKFLLFFLLVTMFFAGDFRLPALDPFGLLPSTAMTLLSQESGIFYNPALSLFNPPVLQYSQGSFSMDSGSVFSSLREIATPENIDYSILSEINTDAPSFAMETRNFFMSGKGGAMGYVYYRSLLVKGERGENFNENNPQDFRINYKIRDRRIIFFNKSYVLKNKRAFMGITTKYVFYKDFDFSLPINSQENFKEKETDLISMGETPVEEGKMLSIDVGISAFITSRVMASVSFVDLPLSKGKEFSPEYIMGALSYSLTKGFIFSGGADLRDYKNDYYFSIVKNFSSFLILGGGYRKWKNEKYYTLVADLRYHHFGGKIGINFDKNGRHGIIFSIGVSDAF